ncbi:hypothetical protein GCM10010498_05750 [Streptomyces cavourensis]|nr:hypothetical protein GCM10010498_05750 [Streptomyces cavourensis]
MAQWLTVSSVSSPREPERLRLVPVRHVGEDERPAPCTPGTTTAPVERGAEGPRERGSSWKQGKGDAEGLINSVWPPVWPPSMTEGQSRSCDWPSDQRRGGGI